MSAPPRIAVFVSGNGRSLENLVERIAAGELECRIALVLSSNPAAHALERARRHDIPALVIDPERRLSREDYSRDVFAAVESFTCDAIVLAGFLRQLAIPKHWLGRMLNIHPALLPDFGGKGFYGERVHQAVLASGAEHSGCTVHYVTDEYDAGPILLQRRIAVLEGDTPQTLAARVFEEEKIALPQALRMHFEQQRRVQRSE